jgi:hypothetical protein
MKRGRILLGTAATLCGVLAAACSSWRTVEVREGWTLYSEKGRAVDTAAFAASFDPAYRAVEGVFGAFDETVRVHAIQTEETIAETHVNDVGLVRDVPGIGRARVRAYHARGDGVFGPATGIYADTPEPGTAVHELVHARIAEIAPELPLWLEEGLACFLGDGFLDGDRWIVDGYACWHVRELREQRLPDKELERVLKLSAADEASVRENVLVHFVGWAIVFDLQRQTGTLDWKRWMARYKNGIDSEEARERIERTISTDAEAEWLKRLADPQREVRLATAKGLWKLRSRTAVTALLDALDDEQDGEVKVALAINALAAGGDVKLNDSARERFWPTVWPALRRGQLKDATEQQALRNLYLSYRRRTPMSSQEALEGLRRYWAED